MTLVLTSIVSLAYAGNIYDEFGRELKQTAVLTQADKVMEKPKTPTHKLICNCACFVADVGNTLQSFDRPAAGCSSLQNISCTDKQGRAGKLESCFEEAVENSLNPFKDLELRLQLP